MLSTVPNGSGAALVLMQYRLYNHRVRRFDVKRFNS